MTKKLIISLVVVVLLGAALSFILINKSNNEISQDKINNEKTPNTNLPETKTEISNSDNKTSEITNPTVNTTDWKTYFDQKYGVALKYPPYFYTHSTGPNQQELDVQAGKTIFGTIPPYFNTFQFLVNSPTLELVVYDAKPNKLDTDLVFGGACGSQIADEAVVNETKSINGKTFLMRQRLFKNLYVPNGKGFLISYCTLSPEGYIVELKTSQLVGEDGIPEYVSTIEDILSTMKLAKMDKVTITREILLKVASDLGVKDCEKNESLPYFDLGKVYSYGVKDGEIDITACTFHAYQNSYVTVYRSGSVAKLISFPQANGEPAKTMMELSYNPTTKQFNSLTKYRGLGDCGSQSVYKWNNATKSADLVEQKEKSECDGTYGEWPIIYPKN